MDTMNSLISVAVLLLVQLLVAANALQNLTTDLSALLAFKDHITHDPGNLLLTNWSANASVCSWTGITCGSRHLRVTGLNLSYMGLVGTIPPELGNMSFLVVLNLKNNSFFGSLPKELARCWRLNDLNLGFNKLSGEIPLWVGSLSKLQYLNLYGNQFSGPIPGTIFNLSSLKVLDLSENQLSGSIPSVSHADSLEYLILHHNWLSGSLTSSNLNISSLRLIDVGDNMLSGRIPDGLFSLLPELEEIYLPSNKFIGKLPSSLFYCIKLKILYLSINNFSGNIPIGIGNLSLLNQLSLDHNSFQGAIPQEIGKLSNLQLLSMQQCGLTGPLPPTIFNMTSLTSAYFSDNGFSGSLPDNFCQHLPFLKVLHLGYNNLSGQLPSNLWQCQDLKVLHLASNNFSGNIPRSIGNLTRLTDLYLYDNKLTGAIPDGFGDLHELEVFSLSLNDLNGLIPPRILNISTLRAIGLAKNRLSGTLPLSLGLGIPNIEEIYLASNRLSGSIPYSIGNFSKLTVLNMPNNSFSGFIPDSIGTLNSLQELDLMSNSLNTESPSKGLRLLSQLISLKDLKELHLSDNPLKAMLPSSIKNVSTSLQSFELGNCQILGSIPTEISKLSSLMLANLSCNGLNGSIPATLGHLQKLQGLYLNDNNLQGTIPKEICQLEKLDVLSLRKNNLVGSLPACLANLSVLSSLYLDCNELSSTIPSALWSLQYILHMNFSSNSFSGFISPNIGSLKVVIDIDLSNNQLSGSIPVGLGGLQNLVTLSLANNTLGGSIPDSFGKLLSMESLDISYNYISGVIPKSLQALSHLRHLNLSFNRLEGEIPTDGPFSKFSAQAFMQNNELCGAPQLLVPPCRCGSNQQSRKTALILKIILPIGALLAIVSIALVLMSTKRRRSNVKHTEETSLSSLATWRKISYNELRQASNGFHASNLLGCGSFGSVYQGVLFDGVPVAIKVFNLQSEAAFKSFEVECEVLSSICHRNLIRIISCCSTPVFKALVLNYMPEGSLERWLYSLNHDLNFVQRLNIMVDVASALEYLHCGYSVPIVHCDLKPSNVLLDEDMVAHVSDFGISKLLGGEVSIHQTVTLATIGYMAPEYGSEGIISVRGDVYSYGILLMEVFTRKKPTDELFNAELSFKQWVAESLTGAVTEIADASLFKAEEEQYMAVRDCLRAILELALICSADSPEERMSAKDILTGLDKIRAKFLKDTGRA